MRLICAWAYSSPVAAKRSAVAFSRESPKSDPSRSSSAVSARSVAFSEELLVDRLPARVPHRGAVFEHAHEARADDGAVSLGHQRDGGALELHRGVEPPAEGPVLPGARLADPVAPEGVVDEGDGVQVVGHSLAQGDSFDVHWPLLVRRKEGGRARPPS